MTARTVCVIQCARSGAVHMQADNIVDRGSIAQTERLIRPHIRRTPVIEVDAAHFGLAAARLTFKLELLQHAGSFNTRGAFAVRVRAGGGKSRVVSAPRADQYLEPGARV